jgi:TIR domain
MTQPPPRVFISYSHDDQAHKDWVLMLSTRLLANGVDILLDQWNLTLGSDLPRFMEFGLTDASRVLAVCSDAYVAKANSGQGGAGYEKMILTGQLMNDSSTDKIIPVVRNNSLNKVLPTFLISRYFADFRNEDAFEVQYAKLLRDIHGQQVTPRRAIGPNPFTQTLDDINPRLSFTLERYVSPALMGTVTFDYTNNNGRFTLGAGDMLFETAWATAGHESIHAYTDPPSIRTVALAVEVTQFADIIDASIYDTSSRVRTPHLGEIVIWQNTTRYYLATKIETIQSRSHGAITDEVTFTYLIAPHKSTNFSATSR